MVLFNVILTHINRFELSGEGKKSNNYARDTATLINLIILGLMLARVSQYTQCK
jgi:hypothetical protein